MAVRPGRGMMEYRIDGVGVYTGGVVKSSGDGSFTIRINDAEHTLKIVSIDARGVEFVLDREYHRARYLERTTSNIRINMDGSIVDVGMHPGLDEIVYKNSGGGAEADSQMTLKSQIPGKVVSIAAAVGSAVSKGDIVCTLESMKMQVGVKAHKDGTIKSIKISEGTSIAKGDVVAEIE